MKKILARVMILTLMCSMLVSCDNAEKLIEKADAALEEAPYTVTMKTEFECDNKEINEILSAMNMEIPMTIDGKNIAMDMSMDAMGYTTTAHITVVDMVMYYNIKMMGQTIKMKATLNEEEYKEFLEESSTQMMLDPEDCEELTVEKKNGKKYITCANVSEKGLKALNKILEDITETFDGKATVSEVSYGITLNDGKYESMDLSCVYSFTMAGETFNVTMKCGADFSYDDAEKVTAPADAAEYEEAKFSDLLG